jgi:periplasmic protein TonB
MKTLYILAIILLSAFAGNSFAQTTGEEEVFTIVESMPVFPGGDKEMMAYLSRNIKYPESAKKEGIHGVVYVKFIVSETGKIKDAAVIRGQYEALNTEALRVISQMPDWQPGTQKGKPVNVQYTLPIRFAL